MDPIFRGCTRGAMVMGIPLVPLVLTLMPGALVIALGAAWGGLYVWVWSMALTLPCLHLEQTVSRQDDQRLSQLLQLFQHWGSCPGQIRLRHRSYAPSAVQLRKPVHGR